MAGTDFLLTDLPAQIHRFGFMSGYTKRTYRDAMPKKLLDAHRALDTAVDLCYRPAGFKTELERLKFLFDLYRNYTEPLIRATARSPRKKKKDP